MYNFILIPVLWRKKMLKYLCHPSNLIELAKFYFMNAISTISIIFAHAFSLKIAERSSHTIDSATPVPPCTRGRSLEFNSPCWLVSMPGRGGSNWFRPFFELATKWPPCVWLLSQEICFKAGISWTKSSEFPPLLQKTTVFRLLFFQCELIQGSTEAGEICTQRGSNNPDDRGSSEDEPWSVTPAGLRSPASLTSSHQRSVEVNLVLGSSPFTGD